MNFVRRRNKARVIREIIMQTLETEKERNKEKLIGKRSSVKFLIVYILAERQTSRVRQKETL
jgi:hypothetical protein